MYLKCMVLDGFKSYGVKTEISGFDQLFNAITGLNGSGKSNILDAICFVLGLSNVSLARCTNMRELIYKNGSTGITKAQVTLTFDNTRKEHSPAGHEQYDEITVRREVTINSRTKYWINGYNASNIQVTDLFHSVQLNIHNPHFLIMQGRITKVLNMKPHEILSMVEEATGVSMYESKKKQTQVAIVKKDHQMRNIDSLINETIVPKFEQLKKEHSGLMEFQKVTAELEHLSKVNIAFTFLREEENCHQASSKIEGKQGETVKLNGLINQDARRIQELTTIISDFEKKKDEEFGGHLSESEEKLKREQMEESKLAGELNHKKDCLKEVEKKRASVQKNFDSDKNVVKAKQKEHEKLKTQLDQLGKQNEANEAALKKAEKDFEAISAGLSRAEEGKEAATLADQLMQAKREQTDAETAIKTGNMKIKHSKAELAKKEVELKKMRNSTGGIDGNEIGGMVSDVEQIKNKLDSMAFDEVKYNEMKEKGVAMKKEIAHLKDDIYNSESQLSQVKFDFKDPIPNFDRSKVLGVVCSLFSVKDPNANFALEKAAGGKLYHVVVDNEQTGKLILEKGALRQRRTLIPLNKVNARGVDARALKAAENIVGKGNVHAALNLVDYDPSLEAAMRYAFGETLVCPNMDIAKKVAFDPRVQKRTVTYDGEVFDPSGTLSGGAKGGGGQVLERVALIQEKRGTLDNLENQYKEMEIEFRKLDSVSKQYFQCKEQYNLKARELELVKQRLQQGDHHRLRQEVEDLKKLIEETEQLLVQNRDIQKKSEKRINELQAKMKDSKSVREREQKEAEQILGKTRKDSEKSRKQFSEIEIKYESLRLEIEDLERTIVAYDDQLKEYQVEIDKLKSEIDQMIDGIKEARIKVSEAQDEVKSHKKVLKAHCDEIAKMQKEKENISKKIEDQTLLIKQLDHDINNIKNSSKDSERMCQQLLRKFPWIEDERSTFGSEAAGYNFNAPDFSHQDLGRKIEKLKTTKISLSKTVNMRANIMLSDKEKESDELDKKRKILNRDKEKLYNYMDEVDQKKMQALEAAWKKINKDFGDIFKTFLPGSGAKLEKPSGEGKTILDGLEVRVSFGGVWKESLTELSGGQRSLVALSLILALLKFNPAPLYILDEVDAALDQSHTQNTGNMIKNHFKNSQFIIVSLKDDMFNNANVLFKTRFVDGNSTVTRVTRK